MAPESFSELLIRLQESHDRSIDKLQRDNIRLSQEIYRLQGWVCRLEDSDSEYEGTQDLLNCEQTFPALIPGMPAELVRPVRYHDRSPWASERNSASTLRGQRRRHDAPAQRPTPTSTRTLTSIVPEPLDIKIQEPTGTWNTAVLIHEDADASPTRRAQGGTRSTNSVEIMRQSSSKRPSSERLPSGGETGLPKKLLTRRPSADSIRRQPSKESGPAKKVLLRGHSADCVQQATSLNSCQGRHRQPKRRPSFLVWKKGSLEDAVANLESQNLAKQKQRFRQLLDLQGNAVTPHCLLKALKKRGKEDWTVDKAVLVIQELCELGKSSMDTCPVRPSSSSSSVGVAIDLEPFVHLMVNLEFHYEPEEHPAVQEVRRILLPQAVQEVIERASRPWATSSTLGAGVTPAGQFPPHRHRQLAFLNAIVGVAVVVSITTLGMSVDYCPSWAGWNVLEAVIAAVFVAEVVIKSCLLGFRGYFMGPAWRWNLYDFLVTLVTLVDVTVSLMTENLEIYAVHFAVVLRAFRLTRIARLVKLLNTPLLAELVNMLAGFQVGIPCLLWVMVLLFIVFFVFGTAVRQMAGPRGESLIAACGATGDLIGAPSDPECQPHFLYAEEFFGTLRTSVFTTFRCVLGDCSSEAGRSLTAVFSHGYGLPFDLVYCVTMVLIIVGLFNIIAAIFVETTINGLKYNNVQRKYTRMYESRYVQQRLELLVTRIQELLPHLQQGHFELNENEFDEVMTDDGVNSILEDLDVALSNRVGLFDMFDSDNNGTVSVSELLATLMKIRGEPQKSDMIASWVALRSLNERFQEFEWLVLENQRRMLDVQKELLTVG